MIHNETLNDYRILDIPNTAYYIPNFIDDHEEQIIINQVNAAPKSKWVQLSNRRLQNWGGIPLSKGMIAEPIPGWLKTYVNKLNSIDGLFKDKNKANHVLVNEYCPGSGILPHLDGDLFHPVIATISLGSSALLDFYNPIVGEHSNESTQFEDRHLLSIYVEPRSLLVLKDEMYEKYLHGIKETREDVINCKVIQPQIAINRKKMDEYKSCSNISIPSDEPVSSKTVQRNTRISLTIRNVPKTKNIRIKL